MSTSASSSWRPTAPRGAAASHTAHGTIETPAFMPVGTAATVKAMTVDMVRATGAEIVLGNTYHLMLRPGAERVARLGGLRRFMALGRADPHRLRRLPGDVAGRAAGSSTSGRHLRLASRRQPARADARARGRDPASAGRHDHHGARRVPAPAGDRPRRAARLDAPSHALGGALQRGLRARGRATACSASSRAASTPSCGASSPARARRASASTATPSAASPSASRKRMMLATLERTCPLLPADRPRYLMGVGKPADLIGAVARGVDLFDCVLPTRSGRTGQAFTRRGPVNLKNARHADDPRAARRGLRLPRLPRLLARLSAPPGPLGRDPGRDAADLEQSLVLSAPDAAIRARHRARPL